MVLVRIRPLHDGDVAAAAEVTLAAMDAPPGMGPGAAGPWLERRTRHFLEHDAPGCWVAERDGAVFGVGLALVRDGLWGLSLLSVLPSEQARGAGTALLRACLGHAEGARGALIASSTDPKAMRAYARAGFDLRPCVAAAGIVERAAIPAGLRSRPTADLEAAAATGRAVRGGAYGPHDLELMASRPGFGVLALPSRGFAIHDPDGSPKVLSAHDDEAAADLLWSCLAAGTRGATAHVSQLTSGQDWAVRVALDAGLALSPEGPVFTRGALGPLRPWIPSGAFL